MRIGSVSTFGMVDSGRFDFYLPAWPAMQDCLLREVWLERIELSAVCSKHPILSGFSLSVRAGVCTIFESHGSAPQRIEKEPAKD